MKKILIMLTYWQNPGDPIDRSSYWYIDKVAPYPKLSFPEELEKIEKCLPSPAIGIYWKGRGKDFTHQEPAFLKVRNVSRNERNEPQIEFKFLTKVSGATSQDFINLLGRPNLLFTITHNQFEEIQSRFEIVPPKEWLDLLKEKKSLESWKDYIGKRFLKIFDPNLTQNQYEDIVAAVFTTLDFDTEQLGYKESYKRVPDGYLYTPPAEETKYWITYDCKHSNFYLNAEETRKMKEYINKGKETVNVKKGINPSKGFFLFVAKGFDIKGDFNKNFNEIESDTRTKGVLLNSEVLLYILYKKLKMGYKFRFAEFRGLIQSKEIKIKDVEEVFRQ